MLIAIIDVTRVFVSHFAVGGGLYLVLSERKALREKSDKIMGFTRFHARFFLLITMVYGSTRDLPRRRILSQATLIH